MHRDPRTQPCHSGKACTQVPVDHSDCVLMSIVPPVASFTLPRAPPPRSPVSSLHSFSPSSAATTRSSPSHHVSFHPRRSTPRPDPQRHTSQPRDSSSPLTTPTPIKTPVVLPRPPAQHPSISPDVAGCVPHIASIIDGASRNLQTPIRSPPVINSRHESVEPCGKPTHGNLQQSSRYDRPRSSTISNPAEIAPSRTLRKTTLNQRKAAPLFKAKLPRDFTDFVSPRTKKKTTKQS